MGLKFYNYKLTKNLTYLSFFKDTLANNSLNTSTNMNKTGYPSTSSYQEKYLKKLKDKQIHQSKTDSQIGKLNFMIKI